MTIKTKPTIKKGAKMDPIHVDFKIDNDDALVKAINEKCEAENTNPSDVCLALIKQWVLVK